MQLRHTFVLAAGTAAALAIGGAAFAAGSDDPRPQTPRVTSPSATSTVRPSAAPTVHTFEDHHQGRGADDPAGDDHGGARAAAAIRSSATAHTIAPTRRATAGRAADDHGGHAGSDDHGRHSGSDDHGGHSGSDDHGRRSGSDDHGRRSGRD